MNTFKVLLGVLLAFGGFGVAIALRAGGVEGDIVLPGFACFAGIGILFGALAGSDERG